jgi:hypothetical protein
VKLTVTVLFVQVPDVYAPPPATVAEAVIVGASLSMSMSLTVVPALLPALSVQVVLADWFAAELDFVIGSGVRLSDAGERVCAPEVDGDVLVRPRPRGIRRVVGVLDARHRHIRRRSCRP